MEDCIFCKIIKKEIPSGVILENEDAVVFRDIKPKAPVHVLVVPKKHITTVNNLQKEDRELIGKLFETARQAAEELGIKEKGYKLSVNVGKGGGQEVFHLHVHLLGGWQENEDN